MSKFKKLLAAVGIAICATSAHGTLIPATNNYGDVTVSFGGIFPLYDASVLDSDKSLILTSHLLQDVDQAALENTSIRGINAGLSGFTGLYVETFDTRTTLGSKLSDLESGFLGDPFVGNNRPGTGDGCAVNGVSSGVVVNGDYGVTNQNVGGEAVIDRGRDNTDSIATTCFGYTPTSGAQLNPTSSVTLDFSAILNSAIGLTGQMMAVDYIGFYWGTIDGYNSFQFYQGNDLVASIDGGDLFSDIQNLTPGNSGTYVNFTFDQGPGFDKLVVTSAGVATEFDNIVNRISSVYVPEPSSITLIALALLGLRRLKK